MHPPLQELGQVDGICSFWEAAQALVAALAERMGLAAHPPAAVEAAREKQVRCWRSLAEQSSSDFQASRDTMSQFPVSQSMAPTCSRPAAEAAVRSPPRGACPLSRRPRLRALLPVS